ncbi:Subtilisin-like protease, partial [Lachnellula cervina]
LMIKSSITTLSKMSTESTARAFFSTPHFAVVGASSDPSKFGHKIFAWYTAHSLPVTPINPTSTSITANSKAYPAVPSLSQLPDPKATAVSIITPPKVTQKVLEEAKGLGVKSVWLQPGTFDDEVLAFARREFENAVGGDGGGGGEGWCVLVDGGKALEGREKLLADISFAIAPDGTPEPDSGADSDDDDTNSQTNKDASSASASTTSTSGSISRSSSMSSSRTSSSFSSGSAAMPTYLIYPIDGASRTRLDSIADTLNDAVGTDHDAEITLGKTASVFVGEMDSRLAASLTNMNSAIKSTEIDSVAYTFPPMREVITVYVTDTGVDADHSEFDDVDIHSSSSSSGYKNDTNGHGTCVTSKVAGNLFGVVKPPNIVSVKAQIDETNSAVDMASGLCAYYMSLNATLTSTGGAKRVKDFIKDPSRM